MGNSAILLFWVTIVSSIIITIEKILLPRWCAELYFLWRKLLCSEPESLFNSIYNQQLSSRNLLILNEFIEVQVKAKNIISNRVYEKKVMQLYVRSRSCLYENFPPSFQKTDLFCVKTVRNHANRSGLPIFQRRFCGVTGSSLTLTRTTTPSPQIYCRFEHKCVAYDKALAKYAVSYTSINSFVPDRTPRWDTTVSHSSLNVLTN